MVEKQIQFKKKKHLKKHWNYLKIEQVIFFGFIILLLKQN